MRRTALIFGIVLALGSLSIGESNWPSWRGADRTGVSAEKGLLKKWPASGPKQLWVFKNAGIGYSSFSIVDDTLYTLGGRDGKEMLIAINANTGKEKWATPMSGILGNGWGDGPRGTPTVDGDHVYALSGPGTLICAKTSDGSKVWEVTMGSLGGNKPGWGYTESVLVDGDKVIVTPGGSKGTVAALNKKTGDVIWQSKGWTDGAQYASAIVVEHGGKRQYIQLTQKTLAGLDATNGKVLWKTDWNGRTAVIPTPIYHDGQVYISSGYGVGCMAVKLSDDNKVTRVYKNNEMENHHGGVILHEGYLYGFCNRNGVVCQDFKTGKTVWKERMRDFRKGAIAIADGMIYLVDESSGNVGLAEATPKGWNLKSQFKLSPQTKNRNPKGRIWSHPVVVNGKLYLRDQELLHCYDVKQ